MKDMNFCKQTQIYQEVTKCINPCSENLFQIVCSLGELADIIWPLLISKI